jgi:hypothetical protein
MAPVIVKLTHAARDVDEDSLVELFDVEETDRGIGGFDVSDGNHLFIPWTSVAWVSAP